MTTLAYDVVCIDAQSSRHALECAVLAFPLLRARSGVMVFTNYVHGRRHDAACPKRGIDAFLDTYVGEIKVLVSGFHLFLERRAWPWELGPCRAEYFDNEEEEPRCPGKTRRQVTHPPT